MIINGSYLIVSDNSGANNAQCIHVLGNFRRRYARIGNTILVTVKNVKHLNNIRNNQVYKALIISTARRFQRPNGQTLNCNNNRVLLLSHQNNFLGTRVYGPLCREIRGGNNEALYNRIISYNRLTV